MSTDFKTLKECIEAKTGAFIGVIIKQSDLKSGTSNEKDWTNKKFTISGEDGIEIELTAWGEDIEKFKVGNKYEFTGFWFKEYNSEPQLSVGKFGKVNLIGTATELPTATGPATSEEEPNEQHIDIQTTTPIPEIGESLRAFVLVECVELLQIEKEVKKTMKFFEPDKIHDGGKIGMFTKEIYRESKKIKFEKASEK